MKKVLLGLLLVLLRSRTLCGEPENVIALKLDAFGSLPLGSSADLFSLGGGAAASLIFFLRDCGRLSGSEWKAM